MIIDYAYFRDVNDISQNVDDRDLKSKIIKAERKLRFLIGVDFYNELVSQYESQIDTSGFTAANLSLYNPYIKEFLAAEAFVYLVTKSTFDITRTGIRTFVEDNSETGTDKLIGEIIRDAKQEAERAKGDMINFLRQEQKKDVSKYPLYDATCGYKMGTGFHITAISKEEDVYIKINQQIENNGD